MDYEALGRYMANKEKAEEMAMRRDAVLGELRRLVSVCVDYSDCSGVVAGVLDLSRAEKLLAEAGRCNEALGLALAEANASAQAAEKEPLRLRSAT
ncbi:MAG: hypothetical protein AB7D37_19345 [Desulfovibrio sp.]